MPVVIYHRKSAAPCMDGFAAACVAAKYLGGQGTYRALCYGDPLPNEVDNQEVFLLDFSFPEPLMEELLRRAGQVHWMDHHKGIQELFCKLQPRLGQHSAFAMEYCGATLTWVMLCKPQWHVDYGIPIQREHPQVLDTIEHHDLWKYPSMHPQDAYASRCIHTALTLKYTEALPARVYEGFLREDSNLEALRLQGEVLLAQQRTQVLALAKIRRDLIFHDHQAAAVNCPPSFSSDLGDYLCIPLGYPVAVLYHFDGMKWVHELRSRGEVDVGAIAKALGGGGHKNAAGYSHARPIVLAPEEHGALIPRTFFLNEQHEVRETQE